MKPEPKPFLADPKLLLDRVNKALANFIMPHPEKVEKIQDATQLVALLDEWDEVVKMIPEKNDPNFEKSIETKKQIEANILKALNVKKESTIDKIKNDDKHVKSFGEFKNEKISFFKPTTNATPSHKDEVSKIRSEISHKLKQLDNILTSDTVEVEQTEPVEELMESIKSLYKKLHELL